LAVVAALLEPSLTKEIHLSRKFATPQALVPRIGESLIDKGLITPENLQKALEYQQQKILSDEPCLIGQALVELGYVDQTTLDQVVIEQIFILHKMLRETNSQLEKRVEERTAELQNALIKLTELNQLKSNFISNISHELRTPLTHIKGYLELLTDQSLGPITPQQQEALDVLQRSENRLETLINNLIQFTLASKGELSLEVHPTQLIEIFEPVLDQVKTKVEAKHINFEASISEINHQLLVDQEKISWIISQLIDNAIKFTPKGGQVVVQSSYANAGLITIAVMDTGIGMPQERMAEIFEPFHQLDGSATRRFAGTGLGLAMVRRIIEAHGFQIKVQSVVGKGSRFEFSLPPSTDLLMKNDRAEQK
jgi:signal transduction histidine kinase